MNESKEHCGEISRLEEKLADTELLLFAVVRGRLVLPIGVRLGKTEKEISEKTFETIERISEKVDRGRMRELMALISRESEDESGDGRTDSTPLEVSSGG
jgi:hypothetical protein